MGSTSTRAQRITALWTVYIVWGSTYLAIRYVVETIPPLLAAGGRYVLAGLILGSIVRLVKGPGALRVTRTQLLNCGFVGVMLCLGGNGLVMIAEQSVPSGLAALLIACTPLFVVLLRRLGGEVPARATVFGVLIGLVGVAVLLLPGSSSQGVKGTHLLLNVLAPLLWSIGSYFATRREMPANALAASAYEMFIGGLVLLAVAAVKGEFVGFKVSQISAASAWGWVYLVGPGAVVAMSAYVWLLANAPISTVATYSFVNPVVAVVLGSVIADEALRFGSLVGGAIIVLAVAVVVRAQGAESRRRTAATELKEPIAPAEASTQPA